MGDVRKLWIEGPAGRLEAAMRAASPPRAAAVIAHPHPLHGGTLHNPVVFHAERELNRSGLVTLRFNFRGVGTSEGEYDDGRGEIEDLAAAVSWLRGLAPEVRLVVVGYSFGAYCGIRHAVGDASVAAFVAIGLAVRRYGFPGIEEFGRPVAVVQASDDEFGGPDEVRATLGSAAARTTVHEIAGTDHLFTGSAPEVGDVVANATRALLAG